MILLDLPSIPPGFVPSRMIVVERFLIFKDSNKRGNVIPINLKSVRATNM